MPAKTILNPNAFECNNDLLTTDKLSVNVDFAAAVTELHTLLCETVTCAPGVAGVMWARYHDARERHGVAAAIEALNRFAVTQKPGAA